MPLPPEKSRACPSCGAVIHLLAPACPHCGWRFAVPPSFAPPRPPAHAAYAPAYAAYGPSYAPRADGSKRLTFALLAILLGGVGVHKFYAAKIFEGVVYLMLSWTMVPALAGLAEGIYWLCSSDEKFAASYERRTLAPAPVFPA